MIIFRWQAHDSRVEMSVSPQRNINFSHQGLKKNTWFLRFSFGVIWKCAFRCNETLIFDIRTSKKTWKKSVFFWNLCHVRNLRAPPFSLNATRSRSKSAHSTYFHIWRYVATYSCTPTWTSWDLLLTALSVEGVEVAYHVIMTLSCPNPPHPTPVQRADVLAEWSA